MSKQEMPAGADVAEPPARTNRDRWAERHALLALMCQMLDLLPQLKNREGWSLALTLYRSAVDVEEAFLETQGVSIDAWAATVAEKSAELGEATLKVLMTHWNDLVEEEKGSPVQELQMHVPPALEPMA